MQRSRTSPRSSIETNLCPPSSVVGVATVVAYEPIASKSFTKTVPVFNLVPAQGEPARFGFEVIGKIPIVIDTSVRSGRDYGVVVSVKNATQTAGLLEQPGDVVGRAGRSAPQQLARLGMRRRRRRSQKQVGKACPASSAEPEEPFLTLPDLLRGEPAGEPVTLVGGSGLVGGTGQLPGGEYAWISGEGQLLGFDGCSQLPFTPAIRVAPEEHSREHPDGLTVDVKVPQTDDAWKPAGWRRRTSGTRR